MQFPKHVYKHGTGKKVDDNGLHTAESALVNSEDELAALGAGWCDSPADAATEVKHGPKHALELEPKAEEKHHKKVK